ncbi:MAG: hydrogenase iron-sulfur subunit [Euryarchaeota archaeon]|nr:hydrogenase iron-sulfur subunit [Euryarchaeota archaeon]
MEPKIVAFCCNWCSYAGADLTGVSRYQYPPNIYIIKVMCSGRIEPSYILRAFEHGADGVLVTGCHIGECHYVFGNEKCQKRVEMTSKLLETLGIDPRRLRLEWISAAECAKFADVVTGFVEDLKKLEPSQAKC